MNAKNTQSNTSESIRNLPPIIQVVERLLFNNRIPVVLMYTLLTIALGYFASHLRLEASFENMIPTGHPYIANYLDKQDDLRTDSNSLRIIVENKNGTIFDKNFLKALREITNEVFYIPGTDRGNLTSLWTPNVHYREVSEQGWDVDNIIPDSYDGSPEKLEQVHRNVLRSGLIGSLVSNDFKSSIILVPLLERDPNTGDALDYALFSAQLEELIRDKYSSDEIEIHIVGFAKIIGDLIEGASNIAMFFAIAYILTALLLLLLSHCWRSTAMAMLCASIAVVWQLGVWHLLGFGLDPYSILIPFLTFAIGVSHAVQNINTMADEVYRGASFMEGAKRSFRLLFIPGSVALLANAVGFASLFVIDIGVIQELALNASIGVAVIILTKMFLLPVLMSYAGVTSAAIRRQDRRAHSKHQTARALARLTEPKYALAAVAVAGVILGTSLYYRQGLQVGDTHPGAAELREDSRYNQDNAYLVDHYSTSTDVFIAMLETPHDSCGSYDAAVIGDRFAWQMAAVPGVTKVDSLYGHARVNIAGSNEANYKWYDLSRNQYVLNNAVEWAPSSARNVDCSMAPIRLYLSDHKAETLSRVVAAAERYGAENSTEDMKFLLAGGNAGIQAVTNIVVKQSEVQMLFLVYGIVGLMVWWQFRSFRVVLAIMFPLYITSMLGEALMTMMGLGIKVATLPVIALGVGIGVDYGIYLYSKLEHYLHQGQSLRDAYFNAVRTTGAAVAFTGITLAVGTCTWIFSMIKFQADMGLLLTFMFLWNMFGAIVLVPSIATLLFPRLRKETAAQVQAESEAKVQTKKAEQEEAFYSHLSEQSG